MKKAVICFTRVPRPGKTKTRLLPILKPEQCADLHWAFLKDLAAVYDKLEADLFVSHAPDPDWEQLETVFPGAVGFFPQKGEDLGEKMYRAIRTVLKLGYEEVLLTGADLPAMGQAHLQGGFEALERADWTIGPTSDGGYYLIGMKKPHKALFRVEGYGGSSVLERTLEAGKKAGLRAALALPCDDVDTPEDLRSLMETIAPESHTGRLLKKWKEEGIL